MQSVVSNVRYKNLKTTAHEYLDMWHGIGYDKKAIWGYRHLNTALKGSCWPEPTYRPSEWGEVGPLGAVLVEAPAWAGGGWIPGHQAVGHVAYLPQLYILWLIKNTKKLFLEILKFTQMYQIKINNKRSLVQYTLSLFKQ